MKAILLPLCALLTGAAAQNDTPEALKKQIEAMRPAKHVWREIQ